MCVCAGARCLNCILCGFILLYSFHIRTLHKVRNPLFHFVCGGESKTKREKTSTLFNFIVFVWKVFAAYNREAGMTIRLYGRNDRANTRGGGGFMALHNAMDFCSWWWSIKHARSHAPLQVNTDLSINCRDLFSSIDCNRMRRNVKKDHEKKKEETQTRLYFSGY